VLHMFLSWYKNMCLYNLLWMGLWTKTYSRNKMICKVKIPYRHAWYHWKTIPEKFAACSMGNVIIKSLNNGISTWLREGITPNMYSLRRSGKMILFDSAQKRNGKQATGKRTDDIIRLFDMNWTKLQKKDKIRRHIKSFIFLHFKCFKWF